MTKKISKTNKIAIIGILTVLTSGALATSVAASCTGLNEQYDSATNTCVNSTNSSINYGNATSCANLGGTWTNGECAIAPSATGTGSAVAVATATPAATATTATTAATATTGAPAPTLGGLS